MNLKEMLSSSTIRNNQDAEDEVVNLVVDTYEKTATKYQGKSIAWNLRITADELSMKQEDVREILEKYYSDDTE